MYLYGTFQTLKATQSASQRLKNNNDRTYQPSHPHKYPERHGDKQTHTHKLRPTAPTRQRQGTLRGLPANDHRERRHRDSPDPGRKGPTPRCRALQPPGPEQSTGQHPRIRRPVIE